MMGKVNEPGYKELSKYLTDEEIASAYVFRSSMTDKERAVADQEFKKLRLQQLQAMSDEQVLQSELMRFKFLIKDYLRQDEYLADFSFANQLKKYIQLLKITHTQFAENINIHKTKLSRLINGREEPNIALMYRLEAHSGKMIPANYWYKLYTKKVEAEIKTNQKERKREANNVKNEISASLST